jgi:hypothetical protein
VKTHDDIQGVPESRVPIPSEPGNSIRLDNLQRPPLAGFVDRLVLIDRGLWFEIRFLQTYSPDSAAVLATAIIYIDALVSTVWENSVEFYNQTLPILKRSKVTLPEIDSTVDIVPESAAVVINIFGLARAGLDAMVDCFYITSRSAHLFRTERRDLEVLSLFSVQLSLPLAVALLARIEQLMPDVSRRLKELGPGVVLRTPGS